MIGMKAKQNRLQRVKSDPQQFMYIQDKVQTSPNCSNYQYKMNINHPIINISNKQSSLNSLREKDSLAFSNKFTAKTNYSPIFDQKIQYNKLGKILFRENRNLCQQKAFLLEQEDLIETQNKKIHERILQMEERIAFLRQKKFQQSFEKKNSKNSLLKYMNFKGQNSKYIETADSDYFLLS